MDGIVLAEKGRDICEQDTASYGPPMEHGPRDHGKRLGWGLVDYLVECHVKDSTRSLSTVGLLATTTLDAELYMVDATGLYPCRALAIGSHSNQINACLLKVDFAQSSVDEGVEKLLDIVRECRQGKTRKGDDEGSNAAAAADQEIWHIPNESIVEIVMMKSASKTIHRRKQAFLSLTL